MGRKLDQDACDLRGIRDSGKAGCDGRAGCSERPARSGWMDRKEGAA